MDLRVILVRFMADKEAHKKIPHFESRAPKLWDKVDRMYKYKQKGTKIGTNHLKNKTTVINPLTEVALSCKSTTFTKGPRS